MEIVCHLDEIRSTESTTIDEESEAQKHTFDLKVWAAKSFAAGGASGERRRTLQVDHASG